MNAPVVRVRERRREASVTDQTRRTGRYLFIVVVFAGLGGWVAGRDVSQLAPLLEATAAVMLVGEASNVGKRWTFKPGAGPAPDAAPAPEVPPPGPGSGA